MLDRNDGESCGDFSFAAPDADTRDFPLLVGYGEGAVLLHRCGLEPSPDPLLNEVMGSILAQAVRAHRNGKATSYSRNKNHYVGLDRYHTALRYRIVIQAVDALERAGLIHHEKGRTWSCGGKGRQSRFWATSPLLDCADSLPVLAPRLSQVLRLADAHGHLRSYRETGATRTARKTVHGLNENARALRIDLTDPRAIRLPSGHWQVPTNDGADTFLVRADAVEMFRLYREDWNHHGRLYGPFYQNLPKPVRSTLTLNGEPTSSADFGNSHIRIAYGMAGIDPGQTDAYDVSGFEGDGRGLIKTTTNTLLNAKGGRDNAIKAVAWDIAKRERKAEIGSEDGARAGPFDLQRAAHAVEAVERRHKDIAALFYTGAGLRFMAIEADIIIAVAAAGAKRNIPVLTIHDECLTLTGKRDEVIGLMHDEWCRRVSVQPFVS